MRCDYLPQDVMTRVDNGIAFYRGQPVLIRVHNNSLALYNMPDERLIGSVPFNDQELDLAAPKLGWVNTKTTCFYVFRRPERRYKQTLQTTALRTFNPMEEINAGDLYYSSGFFDMLRNEYPTVQQALKDLIKGNSRAISKDVAMIIDSFGIIRVYLKTEEVGRLDPDKKIVSIPKDTLSWVVSKYLEGFDWVIK